MTADSTHPLTSSSTQATPRPLAISPAAMAGDTMKAIEKLAPDIAL